MADEMAMEPRGSSAGHNGGTVLVTAGFGMQAQLLIPLLAAAGLRVRAMRASQGDGPGPLELGAHEVVVGDASDPDDARRALEGVDRVYHVGPTFHPREREMGINMVRQAREAGVRHFVFSSVLHPILTGLTQHVHKREIEECLLESGLNFTILQPADYMQASIGGYSAHGDTYALGWVLERRQSLVDLNDVAEVVTKVLVEGEVHHGATYELCSADCLTAHEIAQALSEATGRTVTARMIPWSEKAYRAFFRTDDLDSVRYGVAAFETLNGWYDRFDFVGNSNVLRMLLGREPTRYAEFARRFLARTPYLTS